MKNNIVGTLLFAALSAGTTQAHAASNPPPSLTMVKQLTLNYLGATACLDGDIDLKLFSPYVDPSNKVRGFVVIVHSDLYCALGSGTVNPTFVFLKTADGQAGQGKELPFLRVDPALSEPIAQTRNGPKAITSLFEKGGQLYATGMSYGKDDANCCPSVSSTYRVVLRKNLITVEKNDVRSAYTWDFLPQK
jgi:hypothetical protein